ncbi:DeoR/GlpR family DNA-binding transcription regulator [Millisia brevis]|uniref:DeoR/GlpR family DNA-binding transcription regulator n=1 Tax=Millisia brevis TaxID=264148 RepID=UPI000835644B|nr:DeoR/GlpR family DNA-binding transcription regulator [Millisia brevis]
MYAEERQQAIADLLRSSGRVSVTELAALYEVTTETVRRDLSALERVGMARRVHGGAVPVSSVIERRLSERDESNPEEKERIGKAAGALVPPLDATIILDAGSTVGRLAGHLPRDRRLVVFTHSFPVATRLLTQSNVELHLLPGRLRATTQAAVGTDTVEYLRRLHADVAYVGTNGLSFDRGLSTPDTDEAATKRAIVAAAARVVLTADADKIGQEHTVQFAELEQIDTVVTDDRISDRVVQRLERCGIEVVVA